MDGGDKVRMLFVERVTVSYTCNRCKGLIKKGSIAIYDECDSKTKYNVPIRIRVYWHPECFLKDEFKGKTGGQIIKSLITLFLPMIVEGEAVKQIVIALSIDDDMG